MSATSRPLLLETAPHSVDAEKTVLGALILDPEAIYRVADTLHSSDFYDPTHRVIYEAILDLMSDGSPIDFVTIAQRLKECDRINRVGGSAFLAGLASDVPTSSHVTRHAGIIVEHSRRRQIARIGEQLKSLACEEGRSADELIETAEREFLQLSSCGQSTAPATLGQIAAARYEHYVSAFEADDSQGLCGIPTGFYGIDRYLGGLAPGEMIVLAARPSMGKTALALNIACHVGLELRKSVLIFSQEMSKERIFDRIFGMLTGIAPLKLSSGQFEESDLQDIGRRIDELQDRHFSIGDGADSRLVSLRSKARRLHMQRPIDLIIIDYLQLLQVTDRNAAENQTQRMTAISRDVKQLACELNCPVIAISQLSRECERRKPSIPILSDLRDSGSIEQDADKVLMLYRQGYYDEDVENPTLTDVFIRKNRDGPTGHCELDFDPQRMTFHSVENAAV